MDSERVRWGTIAAADVVSIALTDDERRLLSVGVTEWFGPAKPCEAIAQAMGYDSLDELQEGLRHLDVVIRSGDGMTKQDWSRSLIATELAWASSFYGAAFDWRFTTGWSDEETLPLLRSVQVKLVGLRHAGLSPLG